MNYSRVSFFYFLGERKPHGSVDDILCLGVNHMSVTLPKQNQNELHQICNKRSIILATHVSLALLAESVNVYKATLLRLTPERKDILSIEGRYVPFETTKSVGNYAGTKVCKNIFIKNFII